MGFLDSDLANKAKEQFGGQAADATEQAAGKYIGADAAGSVVGGMTGALGINRQTAAATQGAAGGDAATDSADGSDDQASDGGDGSQDDDS